MRLPMKECSHSRKLFTHFISPYPPSPSVIHSWSKLLDSSAHSSSRSLQRWLLSNLHDSFMVRCSLLRWLFRTLSRFMTPYPSFISVYTRCATCYTVLCLPKKRCSQLAQTLNTLYDALYNFIKLYQRLYSVRHLLYRLMPAQEAVQPARANS